MKKALASALCLSASTVVIFFVTYSVMCSSLAPSHQFCQAVAVIQTDKTEGFPYLLLLLFSGALRLPPILLCLLLFCLWPGDGNAYPVCLQVQNNSNKIKKKTFPEMHCLACALIMSSPSKIHLILSTCNIKNATNHRTSWVVKGEWSLCSSNNWTQ